MGAYFLLCTLAGLAHPFPAFSQTSQSAAEAAQRQAGDGQHDFDFKLGTWKTHIRRLQHPLTGSNTWVELNGTVIVRKVWDGRAGLEEIEANGPAGHFESLTLFLYNPQSHQWSLNFANSKDGTLSQPSIGEFKDGRGEFFDEETFNGRAILVRIIWSDITPNSHRFEQSFSDDGGKTWEANFVATLAREKQVAARTGDHPLSMKRGECDSDWQVGNCKIHVSRLQHPLTGSTSWVQLNGTVATGDSGRDEQAFSDDGGKTWEVNWTGHRTG